MDEQTHQERPPRRWTVAEFERMAEAGIFGPDERVELIDGEILPMSPEGSDHAAAIGMAGELLRAAFGKGFYVRHGHPAPLDKYSQPEPDLAVVRGSPRDYWQAHPRTALLVVEVSRSSRVFDRGRKLRLYARSEIPEYWIIDLVDRCLLVHRDPTPTGYTTVTRHDSGAVQPLHASGTVPVPDLLGPEP